MGWLATALLGPLASVHVGAGPTVDLQWDAPAQCPGRSAVVGELEKYLEAPDDQPAAEVQKVDARVREIDGRWILDLRVEVEGGVLEKHLEAEGCELLASATALMISVLVHPAAVLAQVESAPTEPEGEQVESHSSVSSTPAAPQAQSPRDASPPGDRLRWTWRADGGLALAEVPGVTPSVGLSTGVVYRRTRIEVFALFDVPSAARIDGVDAGARFDAIAGGVRGCFVPGKSRVFVPLCAGVEAGRVRGRGFGLESNAVARSPWLAAQLGPALELRVRPRFAAIVRADAVFGLWRPRFAVDDVGDLFTSRTVGARATVGFELQIPVRSARQGPSAAKTRTQPPSKGRAP